MSELGRKIDGDAINEAYTAALGEDAHTARVLLALGPESEMTPRELAIKQAAEANGIAQGVAAGIQFTRKGEPLVERIITDSRKRLDAGEVLKSGSWNRLRKK